MTRVQHGAGLRRKAKGKIAHAKRGHHARQILFDEANAFDGLNGGVGKFFVAGGEGEGQRVEDQVFGPQSVVVDGDVVDAFGDFEFSLARSLPCRFRQSSGR